MYPNHLALMQLIFLTADAADVNITNDVIALALRLGIPKTTIHALLHSDRGLVIYEP